MSPLMSAIETATAGALDRADVEQEHDALVGRAKPAAAAAAGVAASVARRPQCLAAEITAMVAEGCPHCQEMDD
jgi:hypothetical protein